MIGSCNIMGCGGDGGWIYREIMCCLNTHTHTQKKLIKYLEGEVRGRDTNIEVSEKEKN